jgi:hypothetical protein
LAFAVFIHCGRQQLQNCLEGVQPIMGPSSVFFLDLTIGPESREIGQHRKYDAASHQTTVYSLQDIESIIEAKGFVHKIIHIDLHPSAADNRKILALRLAD